MKDPTPAPPSGGTSRRDFLKSSLVAAGSALLPASSLSAGKSPASRRRPNLVFFLGEGHRPDALSIAGNPILQTPNQDRLAREGLWARNAFCTNALCAPARATLLTGLYSKTSGALANADANLLLPADIPLVTDLLHEAGYEVAILGKVHIRNGAVERPWDYYFGYNSPATNFWHPTFIEGRNGVMGPPATYDNVYVEDLVTDRALRWLGERRGDKPFCLLVWWTAPHSPFYRARRHLDLYNGVPIPKPATFDDDLKGYPGKPKSFVDVANNKVGTTGMPQGLKSLEELVKDYYAGLVAVDESVGRIVGYLEQNGLLEDTAILNTSDHGFFLGEFRLDDKRLMHEPSIRVPYMLRYPRRIPAGTIRDEMLLDVDVAPTLLDLAGLDIPRHMQGKSILPLADRPNPLFRTEWFYDYYEHVRPLTVVPNRGIRTERYKLIHYYQDRPEAFEMYDLQVDPLERDNLYGRPQYAELQRDLRSRLEALRAGIPERYLGDG